MSKFGVSFIVDAKQLGSLMEVLQPYRVEDLNFKLVAGTAVKVRAGDMPAADLVAKLADRTPRRMGYFKEQLLAAGFREGSVYNAMANAVGRKTVTRKNIGGVPHYVKNGR